MIGRQRAVAPPTDGLTGTEQCVTVSDSAREDHGVRASRETVRRRLREADLVWRRPRPVVRGHDPERTAKLTALQELLQNLPADETAVFMDEVEVHTNPKVGSMGMRRGQQATVDTPGENEKRVLAGGASTGGPGGSSRPGAAKGRDGRPGCSAGTWTTCGGHSGTPASYT